MQYLNIFLKELESLNFENSILIVILFAIGYFISKRFEKPIYRILILALAYYFITGTSKTNILFNEDIVFSIGLILPHIKFMFLFIGGIFTSIKNMTANTYFFFVSIYYKILRFINWIKDILLFLKGFFSRSKKEENYSDSDYQGKQDYSYNDKEQSSYDYSNKQNEYSSKNSYNDFKNDESEQRKQRQYDDFRNSSNETYEETVQDEYEYIEEEFKRFYSSSAYIILGVSENDDFSYIKKAYRTLIRIYHPDLNPDDIKLYTEITQNINSAYEKLEKIHK